jgi:hypothetical protein
VRRYWACQDEMHLTGPLTGLAALAGETDPTQAARLLGMAHTIRDQIGSGSGGGPTALFHPLRQRTEGVAQEALGETGFAAAWDAGKILAPQEVIAEALTAAMAGARQSN